MFQAAVPELSCQRQNDNRADPINEPAMRLHANHGAKLLDGFGTLLEGGVLFGSQLDLNDLFEASGSELAGNADVVALMPYSPCR